jgi:hypothetical protein
LVNAIGGAAFPGGHTSTKGLISENFHPLLESFFGLRILRKILAFSRGVNKACTVLLE